MGDVITGDAPNGDGYGAGYEPQMRSSMPIRGLSGSWLYDERSEIVLPVLALRAARVAGTMLFGSFETLGDVAEKCEFEFCDRSLLLLSDFFASSSSDFFCFFGTPNALSHAFKFGVADLSPGDFDFFSASSFSSFSLRSFSRANCSVVVTISSSSMSSEQASFDTESHNKSSSTRRRRRRMAMKLTVYGLLLSPSR